MAIKTLCVVVSLLAWVSTVTAGGTQQDISFVVAGKTANYEQDVDGIPRVLNYHFFAEIFLKPGGLVSSAGIATPGAGGPPAEFEDAGYALEWHGGRYRSERELERNYPDGTYTFSYHTPSTDTTRQRVELVNSRSQGSGLPRAPTISLFQNNEKVDFSSVDPNLDLEVRWSQFERGRADPMGIVNDLLFVIMGDCQGARRAHSGRPFEGRPYLDYTARNFVINADSMRPDNAYQLSVEHAVLDTTLHLGVPGFATFATTTFTEFSTSGIAAPGESCPQLLQPFDPGQADLQ